MLYPEVFVVLVWKVSEKTEWTPRLRYIDIGVQRIENVD